MDILLPQQNNTFNTTKNIQIVENNYISKTRRHLQETESNIKHDPKNKFQKSKERTRTRPQKTRKPPSSTKTRPPNFQKATKFPKKNNPKNRSTYVDTVFPRKSFSLKMILRKDPNRCSSL